MEHKATVSGWSSCSARAALRTSSREATTSVPISASRNWVFCSQGCYDSTHTTTPNNFKKVNNTNELILLCMILKEVYTSSPFTSNFKKQFIQGNFSFFTKNYCKQWVSLLNWQPSGVWWHFGVPHYKTCFARLQLTVKADIIMLNKVSKKIQECFLTIQSSKIREL